MEPVFACRFCLIAFTSTDGDAITNHEASLEHQESVALNSLPKEKKPLSRKVRELLGREVLVEVPGTHKCVCLACKVTVEREADKVRRHKDSPSHGKKFADYEPLRKLQQNLDVDSLTKAERRLKVLNDLYLKAPDEVDRSNASISIHCSICQLNFKAFLNRQQDIDRHIEGKHHKEYVNFHLEHPHLDVKDIREQRETSPMMTLAKELQCSDHIEVKRSLNGQYSYYYCKLCNRALYNDTQLKKHIKMITHTNRVPDERGNNYDQYVFDFVQQYISSK